MYILVRSRISGGAEGNSFSSAARALSYLPCCTNCTADWYCVKAGPVVRWAPDLPAGVDSFLRLGAADLASCIMDLPGTVVSTRTVSPHSLPAGSLRLRFPPLRPSLYP